METHQTTYAGIEFAEQYLDWNEDVTEELKGMLEGMKEALSFNKRLAYEPGAIFPRPLTLMDLKVLNLLTDWHGVRCSGFSIFGITAAMDENGMSVALHDTNFSDHDSYDINPEGIVSRTFALRAAFLSMDSDSLPSDFDTYLDNIPAFKGNNFLVCFNSQDRTDDKVAGVIEYDALDEALLSDGRATHRKPSDNPYLPSNEFFDQTLDYSYAIILTNHYLKRLTLIPEGYPDPEARDTLNRYQNIKTGLEAAKSDGHVDLDEAIELLSSAGHDGTLISSLCEPNTRKLHLYFSEKNNGGAFNSIRHDFDFEDLF